MASSIEFRNTEDEIVFETDNPMFMNNIAPGAKVKFEGKKYEVIESIMITEKKAFWWSFGLSFDTPKMIIYLDDPLDP